MLPCLPNGMSRDISCINIPRELPREIIYFLPYCFEVVNLNEYLRFSFKMKSMC